MSNLYYVIVVGLAYLVSYMTLEERTSLTKLTLWPLITTPIFSFAFNIFLSRRMLNAEVSNFNAKQSSNTKEYEIRKFLDRLLPKQIKRSLLLPSPTPGTLYKKVTILFADIVGFTAYSSGRPPSEVVEMLSSLFMEFDKLCHRLDLYKLYTIGDCYVLISQLNDLDKPEDGAARV